MAAQLSLLREIERLPRLNPTVPPGHKPRLQRACLRLLHALRVAGRISNREALDVAGVRYSARFHELQEYLRREHGLGPDVRPITCDVDPHSGTAWYTLAPECRP